MSVYIIIIIIIYKIINSPLLYYLLRHDCPEVGNPPQPQCTKNPPRRHILVRARKPCAPSPWQALPNSEEIQEQHSAAIDNEDMLNVVTRRYHQTPFALAVMHA